MKKTHILVLALVVTLIFLIMNVILKPPKYDVWTTHEMQTTFNKYCQGIRETGYDPIGVPVLYINMNRSKKRRDFMEQQLSQLSLDYERIPAVDGKALHSLTHGTVNNILFHNNYSLSPAELGCTLSHILAAKQLLERNLEVALVMEDDCVCYLIPYWNTTIPQLMQNAPDDWEILQLFSIKGRCIDCKERFFAHNPSRHALCRSTGAYLLTKRGAVSILRNCGMDTGLGKPGDPQMITLNAKQNERQVPHHGVADRFIYDSAVTYVYSTPLFFMGDEFLESTIHINHESEHISGSHKTISIYKRRILPPPA